MKLSSKMKRRRETFVKTRGSGTLSEGSQSMIRERTEKNKSMCSRGEYHHERRRYVLESGV